MDKNKMILECVRAICTAAIVITFLVLGMK